MPEIKRKSASPKPAAFGLNNDTEDSKLVNEEVERIEAVSKVLQQEEFLPVGDIRVQTIIEILNVREAPNMRAKILFVAKRNDIFLTDTLNGEWLLVRTTDAVLRTGYVVAKFVKEVDHGQYP
jgi:hypothetical protein